MDPLGYLRDALDQVSAHPASRVAELAQSGWIRLVSWLTRAILRVDYGSAIPESNKAPSDDRRVPVVRPSHGGRDGGLKMLEMRNPTCLRTILLLVAAYLVCLPALAASVEPARGTLLFEYYWGVDGTLGSLLGLPTFPNYPDDREWRTSFEGPTDWRDNYGTYVRGYLYPPGTGNYTFWIASDDQSQLWLSTDENPAHIVQIASVTGWTPPRDFDNTGGGLGGPQQKSSPIRLTAGKRYYIEALQAEGIGGRQPGRGLARAGHSATSHHRWQVSVPCDGAARRDRSESHRLVEAAKRVRATR